MPRQRAPWMRPPDDVQVPCRRHGTTHAARNFGGRVVVQNLGSVWKWNSDCNQALQELRIERKHADLAYHVVYGRAQQVTTDANKGRAESEDGIATEWVMDPRGLNYQSLVWVVRGYLEFHEEASCSNCGDPFAVDETGAPICDHKHFTFDHIEPPRGSRDWERLHARNIIPRDPECNSGKSDTPYAVHLAIEWQKTITRALAEHRALSTEAGPLTLF